MARFRKDVLRPGSYSVPDATGKGRRVIRYSGPDIRHLAQRFREMKAAGLAVPVCWEHQPDATPDRSELLGERIARRATQHFGWVEDVNVRNGVLEFELDIPDEADARQLEKVRYASPGMYHDWTDGSGRTWPGRSVIHLAATPRPVQHRQGAFERLSLSNHNLECLSLADWLGDPPMEELETGTEKGQSETKYDAKEAISKLQGYGIHLPEDTDESNFFERLCVALHALDHSDSPGDTDTAEEEASEGDDMEATAGNADEPRPAPAPNPVMMSLERAERRLAALERQAADLHRDKLEARIKALHTSGRVSKPVRDKLLHELRGEKLSLGDRGELTQTPLVVKVAAYEELEKGHASPILLGLDREGTDRPKPVVNPEEEAQAREVEEVANKLSRGRYTGWKSGQK